MKPDGRMRLLKGGGTLEMVTKRSRCQIFSYYLNLLEKYVYQNQSGNLNEATSGSLIRSIKFAQWTREKREKTHMSNTTHEKGYIATGPMQDGMIGWRHWLSVRWLDGVTDSAWDDWMASLTQREMIGWRQWLSVRWLDSITDLEWDDCMAPLTQSEMIG